MPFYSNIRDNVADPLIAQYGTSITFIHEVGNVYDPVTGSYANATQQTIITRGVKSQIKKQNLPNTNLVKEGDQLVLLSASQLTDAPIPGDTLQIGQELWKIVYVMPVDPGGTALIYKCFVRK